MQLTGPELRRRYGPVALVTGAARGLGAEFARQLAASGLDLLLVDRLEEELRALAGELAGQASVQVRVAPLDLADPRLAERLPELTRGLEVGLLVCAAGISPVGRFHAQDPALQSRLLDINCRAPLILAHGVGRGLRARGRGGIILVSSGSGFVGTSLVALYAASKAYDRVLAEGLWAELREAGVDVLALSPGLTETPGLAETSPDRGSLPARSLMQPGPVVRAALGALGGAPGRVPGLANQLSGFVMSRLLPRRTAALLLERGMRALYPRSG